MVRKNGRGPVNRIPENCTKNVTNTTEITQLKTNLPSASGERKIHHRQIRARHFRDI